MAARFSIEIVPELPPGAPAPAGRDYPALRGEIERRTNEWRQLIYRADGRMYADYPAEVVTVLEDLEREAAAFAGGRSHAVTVSGRTVAQARCEGGQVWFDPPGEAASGPGAPLDEVLSAFEAAAAQVRCYLEALLAGG